MNEQSPVRPLPLVIADELFRDGGAIRLLHSGLTFAGVAEVKCLVNARFSPSGNTRFNVSGNACRAARVLTRGAVWNSRYPIPARVLDKRGKKRLNSAARTMRHIWFSDRCTGSASIHCVIRTELADVLATLASRRNSGVATPERRTGRSRAAKHLGYTAHLAEGRSLGLVISTTRLDKFQTVNRLLLAKDLLAQIGQQLRQTVSDRANTAARNAERGIQKFREAWGGR